MSTTQTAAADPRPSVALVRKAIKIQGHVVMYNSRGQEMHVRRVDVRGGKWVTDHLTESLCGYVMVSPIGKIRLTKQAIDIIARADEITAKRDAVLRAAGGRD